MKWDDKECMHNTGPLWTYKVAQLCCCRWARECHYTSGFAIAYFILFCSVDVLSTGPWSTLKELEDLDLRRLAEALPSSVLRCRATSTTKKYLGAFRRWKMWAADHKLPVFPVEGVHIALYLQHLAEAKCSKSAVEEAVNGLAWVHSMAGISSPTISPIVQTTLEGLRRTLAKPVNKKSAFTVEMLKAIVEDAKSSDTLTSIRLASVCLLSFAGFLRFDELANIRPCDLTIGMNHLAIQIPHSKTDQLRQGSELIIARTFSDTCPVAMLENYIQRGNIQLDSNKKLFRPVINGKAQKLRETGGLSHSRMSELLKEKLQELGFPPADFSLHSLRAGGATAAAKAGVPDRMFKRHGRWKSESAKDGYVEDTLENRLSVSQNLGL